MSCKLLIYLNNISKFNYGNLHSNLELAKGFTDMGFEVKLVVNKKTEYDVTVPYDVIPLNAKGDFDRPFKLKKVIEREKPKALIANMFTQMITASVAKKILRQNTKVKFIGVERDVRSWHRKWWKYPYRIFIKRLFNYLDWIVAISPAIDRDLQMTYLIQNSKIKLIYNPFDIESIRAKAKEPLEPELGRLFRSKTITWVGRLDRQKEPILAIEIFMRVLSLLSDVSLLLIGDGELREATEEKIKKCKLEDRVFLLGYQENPYKLIGRSDLLLHTASREGLGRVIVEAMVLGVPPVALYTNESGYRELLEDCRCGEAIPYQKTEHVAKKIANLLKENALYREKSQKCISHSEQFRTDKIVKQYIELIGTP